MFSFEKIKKIDYILVLVCGLLGSVVLIFVIANIISCLNWFHHEPQVDIVDTVKNPSIEIKENIDFFTKIKDCYVFSVKSNAISSDEIGNSQVTADVFSESKSMSKSENVINYIFVKEKEEHKLFPHNVFVYRSKFMNEEETYRKNICDYNIYAVIMNDTDQNKTLNIDDDIALYVSDYDGTGLKKISDAIMSVELVDENLLLFSQQENEDIVYYAFDCKSGVKTFIKSIAQKSERKDIQLW